MLRLRAAEITSGDLEVNPSGKIKRLDGSWAKKKKKPSLIFLMGSEKLCIKAGVDLSGTAGVPLDHYLQNLTARKISQKEKKSQIPPKQRIFFFFAGNTQSPLL